MVISWYFILMRMGCCYFSIINNTDLIGVISCVQHVPIKQTHIHFELGEILIFPTAFINNS